MLPIIILSIENPSDRDLMTDFYLTSNMLLYCEARKYLDVNEDVEDIVYEALTKIIEKIEVFRDLVPRQRVQYALTTVRNLSYILLKRQKHFVMIPFDEFDFDIPADNGNSAETIVEKKAAQAQLKRILSELDIEERMLLEQKYILRWKDDEIAAKLNIQPQSVRMKFTRAKRNLLAELQSKGFVFSDWQKI